MISFSILFHLASALCFGVLVVMLAKERARLAFLRKWCWKTEGKFLVLEVDFALKKFADAIDVEFTSETKMQSGLPCKVRFQSLFALHQACQIVALRLLPEDVLKLVVSVKSHHNSTEAWSKSISHEFSDKIVVAVNSQVE